MHGCTRVILFVTSRWLGSARKSTFSQNVGLVCPRRLMQPICSQVIKSLPVQQFLYSSEIIKCINIFPTSGFPLIKIITNIKVSIDVIILNVQSTFSFQCFFHLFKIITNIEVSIDVIIVIVYCLQYKLVLDFLGVQFHVILF